MKPYSLTRLTTSLSVSSSTPSPYSNQPARGTKSAAVVFLLTTDDDPLVTFVTRARSLRHHGGQIALPGGAVEPTDSDIYTTAFREAEEEIGLRRGDVSIIGKLPALRVAASGYDVTPVVATWEGKQLLQVKDPGETAALHAFKISALADPKNRFTAIHPSGRRSPGFAVADVFIWGLTAHIIDAVLALAGWQQPWDRHVTRPVPDQYL